MLLSVATIMFHKISNNEGTTTTTTVTTISNTALASTEADFACNATKQGVFGVELININISIDL